jgi:hypothetical protein
MNTPRADEQRRPSPRSHHAARGFRWVALLAVLALVLSCSALEGRDMSWPGWGFTHTQFSADYGSRQADRVIQEALTRRPLVQNQHIMGWGADNPEPEPGVYDFASLDRRIDLIRKTQGIPVITLCCAPDWMKGGRPGETRWDQLTLAPLPEHYDEFAELCARIARRYPDVKHFMVWNEFKGFYDEKNARWDARGYTELYNQVYRAVKEVNPRNNIGGPYIDMANPPPGTAPGTSALSGPWGIVDQRALDAFDYWLAHKHGADFAVIDGHATTRSGAPDEFTALQKFGAVSQWVQARTDLPLWWAEWYVEPAGSGRSPEQEVALRTAAMIEMAKSGVHTSLYWNPAPGDSSCTTCLWTDTATDDGGRPLPLLTTVLQNFARWFPPGTPLEELPAPATVRVLAQPRMAVVTSIQGAPTTVSIDGRDVRLAPYQTRWISRTKP